MFKWIFAIFGYTFFRLPGALLGYFLGSLIQTNVIKLNNPNRLSSFDFEINLLALSSILIKSDLKNASFLNSDLHGADFSSANLEMANFEHASLRSANFSGANLNFANFSYANLKGVNFEGASLEKTIFNGAVTDKTFSRDNN